MNKKIKQIISTVLILILVFSSFPIFGNNLFDFGFAVNAVSVDEIPSYYSTKDQYELTPVKNQCDYSTCWAFAVVAAAETNLIVKGLADSSIDLSELHLANYMYNDSVDDPLGNFDGDILNLPQDHEGSHLNKGGYAQNIYRLLFRWTGLADEETMMYEDAEYSIEREYPNEYANSSNSYRIKNIYNIRNTKENNDRIKSMIMEYGSAYVSIATELEGVSTDTKSYYQNKTSSTDHAVIVLGWDDNYPKENFNGAYTPQKDGAWLMRNSWGTGIHDGGYVWVSYEEASIQEDEFHFYEFDVADLYDYNYQYDGGVKSSSVGFSAPVYFANVFEAKHNEYLKAVAIENSYFADYNTYEINIYRNLTDPNNPTSGELVEDAFTVFEYTEQGFFTVDLQNSVKLSEGELFAIVVKSYEMSYDYYDGNISFPIANEGQSFYSFGREWIDASTRFGNFRIKAFTSTDGLEIPKNFKANLADTFVNLSWKEVENATEYNIFRSVNDKPYELVATTNDISYTDNIYNVDGTKIRYKVRAVNELKDVGDFSSVKTIRLPVEINVESVDIDNVELHIDNTTKINCVILPSNATDKKLAYTSTNENVAVIDDDGNITAVGFGETTIKVVSRDGGKRDSATLTVVDHTYISEITKNPTHLDEGETTYRCECNHTYTEPIDKLKEHTYTSEITTEPTHLSEGVETFTCKCGDSYTRSIAKFDDHIYKAVITEPTCITEGYTTYTCICGDSYIDDEVANLGHSGGLANCKDKAVCTACGEEYGEINADNHKTVVTDKAVAATCSNTGLTEGSHCETCGTIIVEQKELPIIDHSYNSEVTAPGCETAGYTTYTCSGCGDSYVADETEKLGHTGGVANCKDKAICDTCGEEYGEINADNHKNIVTDKAVEATCSNTGLTEGSHCEACDTIIKEQTEEQKLDHSYDAVVTEPTCETAGYTTYTCSGCGDSYVADENINLGHSGGVANCKDKAICTACGKEYGEINTDNHKTVVTDKAVAATCSNTGLTEGSHCEACDTIIKEQTVIGKISHNYNAVTVNPTCDKAGSVTNTCIYCGDKDVQTIPATGHSYNNGICSGCGDDKTDGCSCNCHKGGISKIIFKIILIFQKIFKTNKVCSCGVNHY